MAEKNRVLHEIEEPKYLRYAAFLSRNKWRVVAGVSLVVGVLLVVALVQSLRKSKHARAFEAHLKAQTPEQYERVGRDFPGTFYGSFSLIEAGNLYFEKQRFAEARRVYQSFLRSYPESRFRASVYNLLGATFEAEKKYDDAMEYYRRAQAFPSVELQAKLNRGRCWELKGDEESKRNPQLALDHYDKAGTFYRQLTEASSSPPGAQQAAGPWRREAQSRMTFLREKEREARRATTEKKVDKGNT